MQTINLYRYTRADGGVTVSTVKPDGEYTELYRLVADEGMVLTDGATKTSCVDTTDVSVWSEVVDNQDNTASTLDAEIIEKAKAYDILMGVNE